MSIQVGDQVTFGSGDRRFDPVGEVLAIYEEAHGMVADVMWPTHENHCNLSDLRAAKSIVLVTVVDEDSLGVEMDDVLVSTHHIEDEWRQALDAAKALATLHGCAWDVTLQARNELNMG